MNTSSNILERFEAGSLPSIDHSKLVHMAEIGGVNSAKAVGIAGSWALIVSSSSNGREWLLTATRTKEPREFAKVETLLDYLADLGVSNLDVDVSTFPNVALGKRTRPDRSEAMRALWKADLKEARESGTPVPHEEVMARRRTKWEAAVKEDTATSEANREQALQENYEASYTEQPLMSADAPRF